VSGIAEDSGNWLFARSLDIYSLCTRTSPTWLLLLSAFFGCYSSLALGSAYCGNRIFMEWP